MEIGNNSYMDTKPPMPNSFRPEPIFGSSSFSEAENSISEEAGTVLFFIIIILSVIIICICSVRQYYNSCSGTKISTLENRDIRNSEQYYEDRALAETLQRRFNEEERDRERLFKRKERRMWFEYYIKPLSMVVEKSDVFHAYLKHSALDEDDGTMMVETDTQQISKEGDEAFSNSDIEEHSDDADMRRASQFNICNKDDENASLYLKLPASGRCIDGTCAFCIDEYEVGDKVVWSDLQCPHAFHKECMMQWLSKGKKRCPICRHWFVPGSKIDDQKLAHGEAWQHALSEMEQREKEKNEKQAIKVKKEMESENDLEQGIAEITNKLPSSPSIDTTITSESYHTKPGYEELGCSISSHDLGDSKHSVDNSCLIVSEMDDIESHQTVSSISHNIKATEE